MSKSDYITGIKVKPGDIVTAFTRHTCANCRFSRPHEDEKGVGVWCKKYSYPCGKGNTCASWELKDAEQK